MERIFISYKRDDKEKVFSIKNYIEKSVGEQCWIDIDGIESDAQFEDVIISAINNAEIFLFMYSLSHTKIVDNKNDWTMREINFAEKKRKRVVILNLDGAPLIDRLELRYGLHQQIDTSSKDAMKKLCEDLKRWLAGKDILNLCSNELLDKIRIDVNNKRLRQTKNTIKSTNTKQTDNASLSYFTGELHSENYELIIHLAEELGYNVHVYESNKLTQFDFIKAVFRDTATIVDATIPDDSSVSTIYPLLTAHINILDHILVFSDNQYEDGTQILPLNIAPQRKRTTEDWDFLKWLMEQLVDLRNKENYERFEIKSLETLDDYKEQMEAVMSASLELHKPKKSDKKKVMISYRNSCSKDVEVFRKREEAKGEVEIKVLPPGSLCDDYEAHTPMRRWMLVGLLEDHIRSVDEVWVYYNDIYTNSWWTLAELVMVAYINHERAEKDKVKVLVYDAGKKRFLEVNEEGYPTYLHIQISDSQHQKLARYLSNTRPDTMGPETQRQIDGLKRMARVMRLMTKKRRAFLAEQMRPMIEQGVPGDIPEEDRNKMVDDLLAMYSDPKAIMAYANDDVFKETFWNNISYQTNQATVAFRNGRIDVDTFMDTPMQELTKFKDENLHEAAKSNSQIKLKGKKYYVGEGKKRYLWLASRMGMPTVKDAPGLEVLQTYNLLTHDQIVGMVMKKLL